MAAHKFRYGYSLGWALVLAVFILHSITFLTAYYSGITGHGYNVLVSINSYHEAHSELALLAATWIFGGWFFIDTFRREVCCKK